MAIEHIAKATPVWEPQSSTLPKISEEEISGQEDDTWMLSFESFDIKNVVKNGVPLLASPGKEFELEDKQLNQHGLDPKQRLALQRKQLQQRLGLGTEFLDGLFLMAIALLTKYAHCACKSRLF
jgi:TATA-binding protein-associated factor